MRPVTVISSEEKGHIPALDGIRGLAIVLVLVGHLSEGFFKAPYPWRLLPIVGSAGWMGVDLFFVLSGFLITGILWESRDASHYFRNFYARRALRLAPAYYTTLLVIFVVMAALLPSLTGVNPIVAVGRSNISMLKETARYWPYYFLYLVNVLIAVKRGFPYPAHFWSLAVEEHFYLVWPLLMHRLTRRTLVNVCAGVVAGAFLLRCAFFAVLSREAIYSLTPFRMDDIAIGALIALLLRGGGGAARLRTIVRYSLPVSFLGCLAVALALKGWRQYGFLAQTFGWSSSAIFFASVLVLVLIRPGVASCFSNASLRFFGKYSYAIYIIHPMIFMYCRELFACGDSAHYSMIASAYPAIWRGRPFLGNLLDGLSFVLAAISITLLLALLSWRFIEAPALALKRFFPYERRTPVSGAALVSAAARE